MKLRCSLIGTVFLATSTKQRGQADAAGSSVEVTTELNVGAGPQAVLWRRDFAKTPDRCLMDFKVEVSFLNGGRGEHQACVFSSNGKKDPTSCGGEIAHQGITRQITGLAPRETAGYRLNCENEGGWCKWDVIRTKTIRCEQVGEAPNQCHCREGFYYQTTSGHCKPWGARTFSDTENVLEVCYPCPAGHVCKFSQTSTPTPCDAGKLCTEGQDPENISDCPPGQFCESGKPSRTCSMGKFCAQGAVTEEECPPPWVCPPGSSTALGVGIRNIDPLGTHNTIETIFNDNFAEYMTRVLPDHPVLCKNGGALTGFKMQASLDGKTVSYAYGCDDTLSIQDTTKASTEINTDIFGVESLVGVIFQCTEAGHVLAGIAIERTTTERFEAASTCVDMDADTVACEESLTEAVPLYLNGMRSPNALAHLSALPVRCGKVGQALRSVELLSLGPVGETALRYRMVCCELGGDLEDNTVFRRIRDDLTGYTNSVTACGARHGWITPEQVLKDNEDFDPTKISDRIAVLGDRVLFVIRGIEVGFHLESLTDDLRVKRETLLTAPTIDEALAAAASIEQVLVRDGPDGTGRCPSAPVFRWVRACSGTECSTMLEFGLKSEWSEGVFEEFVQGVTESREEMHGTEITSGTETTMGSESTISDSFSVSTSSSVGFNIGFASASVELGFGYERTGSDTRFDSETIIDTETRSVELSSGISRQASSLIGKEIVRTSEVSVTRSCETSCTSKDNNQIVLWQWIAEQTDPNSRDATVYTCIFICRSAAFNEQPPCPGGQCLNNDCTICQQGTFTEARMDEFYSFVENEVVENGRPTSASSTSGAKLQAFHSIFFSAAFSICCNMALFTYFLVHI